MQKLFVATITVCVVGLSTVAFAQRGNLQESEQRTIEAVDRAAEHGSANDRLSSKLYRELLTISLKERDALIQNHGVLPPGVRDGLMDNLAAVREELQNNRQGGYNNRYRDGHRY